MIMKVRKRPVEVEAVQWTGENLGELIDFCNERLSYVELKGHICLYINTLEGSHVVLPNDYIIKGIKGEFYPCKPDIFEMTYERID